MKKLLLAIAIAMAPNVFATDYENHEVTITTSDGTELGATLTLPQRPKAAILLVTGSGIQNRDEEIVGKTPFKTLAEALSGAGYAVLRVDDRGFRNPSDAEHATIDTDLDDARSAFIKMDSLMSGVKKGIIGHSSGGTVAIRLGASEPKVDFIVTLAAPAWQGDSIIMSQARALATALTGRWDGEALQRELMTIAKSPTPTFMARPAMIAAMTSGMGEIAKMPQVRQQIEAQIDGILSPWYRSMLRFDPAESISAVKIPFLALNGSKDIQVLPQNLETIKQLNPQSETLLLDGHNHLFQHATTGLPQEYSTLEGDLSQETLDAIIAWLNKL